MLSNSKVLKETPPLLKECWNQCRNWKWPFIY